MKEYPLEKHWNLLFTRCAVKGPQKIFTLRLLVDTGSTYTILPVEALESAGYDTTSAKDKVRITTASGYLVAPQIKVQWLHIFGLEMKSFSVVAYTLPEELYADGLVGMDILNRMNAIIDVKNGIIKR